MTELYDMTFPPRTPVIEGLLLCGTYLFVGSPKVGKSFFMAQIGYHVATGIPLWDYPVHKGDVLYLALEDDYARLQNRLNLMFGIESVDGLYFATRSMTLADGLVDQMAEFLRKHPATRLIIIDTFQMVRETGNESYSYTMDYQNINALKSFSDMHSITIMIVHHTRKMESDDICLKISGTNALFGASDGAFVLSRKRNDTVAKLQVVGRDQADQELTLEFNKEHCIWELVKADIEPIRKSMDPRIEAIAAFMADKDSWTGTASEFLEQCPGLDVKANVLTRILNVNVSDLYNRFGITFSRDRSGSKRSFTLIRHPPERENDPEMDDDDMTINDGISNSGPVMEISSLSSLSSFPS